MQIIGHLNWDSTTLFVVATVLGRFKNDSHNKNKCLSLLKEMYILCLHIKNLKKKPSLMKEMEGKNLKKQPSLMKEMEGVIKEAMTKIVEASASSWCRLENWEGDGKKNEVQIFLRKSGIIKEGTHVY